MTTVQITLPDALALRARSEGLLSDSAIQRLLEEAMRRQAGRRLMQTAQRLQAADIAPMSEEEVAQEIEAYRAERRAGQGKPPRGTQ